MSSPAAAYWEIDFSTYTWNGNSYAPQHGRIMDVEYSGTNGFGGIPGLPGVTMTISAENWNNSRDYAVAWNPFAGDTSDRDLWAPFYPGPISSPNNPGLPVLDTPAELGNILILQESTSTGCSSYQCYDPNDEGSRPAGYFEFTFSEPVTINALDFVDVENAETGSKNSEIYFWTSTSGTTGGENTTGGGQYAIQNGSEDHWYVPNTGGEQACQTGTCNTWDRVSFNVSGVLKMRIEMGGSGGLTKIIGGTPTKQVPEPATLALFALGLLGLYLVRRRRAGATAA